MSAPEVMPYFIKPSLSLTREMKEEVYPLAMGEIAATLGDTDNVILKMATINCILKTHIPYYYWVGFYIVANGRLEVGPYQGTLGCLHIDYGRGVCGKAALERRTQVVKDCHTLIEGSQHISCDPNSRSEIVVPVLDADDELIAVFDVDSTLAGSFDDIDQRFLESMIRQHFGS